MNAGIPNVFHFVFGLKKQVEPFHLCYFLCLESCRRIMKPDAIHLYYIYEPWGEYWNAIRPHLKLEKVEPNEFVLGFKYPMKFWRHGKYRYAHQSDFIRIEKLNERGGIYADMDTIFVRPPPERLWTQPFVLGRENNVWAPREKKEVRSLCNAFIMAKPRSEFGESWLLEMRREFTGEWSNHSTILPQKIAEKNPDWVHIEPGNTFYKYAWSREDLTRLFEKCETDMEGVVSIHLWSHLWWEKARRDFSNYYAGLMTTDHVRTVDTTYNLLARRFLP